MAYHVECQGGDYPFQASHFGTEDRAITSNAVSLPFFFLKVISKFEVTWPESRCASYSRYCTPKLRHFRIMPTDRTALRFYLTAIRHVLSRAMLKLRWARSRVSFRNTGPVRLTRGGWKYIYEMIYYNKWFKSNASCGLDLM